MDTQLVRLDPPYNVICGSDGSFALHIATLIVVKEKSEEVAKTAPMSESLSVASYPVVVESATIDGTFMGGGKGTADGQVWMHTELKNCYVVCPQNHTVFFNELKDVMEFYVKQNMVLKMLRVASSFSWSMTKFGCKILLPTDENNKPISDFEVCLEFEEHDCGKNCMVYADNNSDFYFYEFFSNDPDLFKYIQSNYDAIKHMAQLRDSYLRIFRYEGMRSITFTTKNEDYQWFVDDLNTTKIDG